MEEMKKFRPASELPRRILSEDQLDDLGEAILSLTREIYVITDRQLVLEAVLAKQGVDLSELEQFEPPPEVQAKIDAKRDAMLTNLFRALKVVD
jgi:hypothetical protein